MSPSFGIEKTYRDMRFLRYGVEPERLVNLMVRGIARLVSRLSLDLIISGGRERPPQEIGFLDLHPLVLKGCVL